MKSGEEAKNIRQEIRAKLLALSDEDYRKFNEKLQTSVSEQIGVRIGEVRKIASELAKTKEGPGWRGYMSALAPDFAYEERLVAGMSIFYAKTDILEKIEYAEKFIPYIDGWAVCDTVCSTIKLRADERDVFWDYAVKKAVSGREFEARFGLVVMRGSFVDDEHLDRVLEITDGLDFAGYYDSMGAAWLLADCMAKFPQRTFEYMKVSRLNDMVYNKAISKMRESYRVSPEMKNELKQMKRPSK